MTSPAKQGPARSFCMYEEANGNPELMETLRSGRCLYGQWFSEEHSRGYTRVIFLSAVNFNSIDSFPSPLPCAMHGSGDWDVQNLWQGFMGVIILPTYTHQTNLSVKTHNPKMEASEQDITL